MFITQANARNVVVKDNDGRSITFDVRASGVNVQWYADLLRDAAHGDEIERVTIRIVPERNLRRFCGGGAAGCYTRGRIVVPAGQSRQNSHTLLHEYGHHLDFSTGHRGLSEPNGTRRWWAARRMAQKLRNGQVARSYALGWERSIGEIFAEDYAQLHLQTFYQIRWLRSPGDNIRQALKNDLENVPATPRTSPGTEPVVIHSSGALLPDEMRARPFSLLGPGRRATYTVTVNGASVKGSRIRLQIVCGDQIFTKHLSTGRRSATIDRRKLGPGDCEITLTNTSDRVLDYDVKLRLAVTGV